MLEELKKIAAEVKAELVKIKNSDELRDLEVKILGRKGELTTILRQLKDLTSEERQKIGKLANEVKADLAAEFGAIRSRVEGHKQSAKIDLTLPGKAFERGHLHPISQVQYRLEDFFTSLGFIIEDGPELESEYYNFEALNIPANHPARDIQDTFFINEDKKGDPTNRLLLRTQTSPVQIRAMRQYGAPLRVVVPGRCFRYEATDVRHEHTFDQLEGLMVDREITITHLKAVLEAVAHELYGSGTKVRLRPKFYPFVEPGFNGEVSCFLCHGDGCRLCKQSGWLEIFGAGLVHPNVLLAGGLDPKEYSGFAFGFGLNRLVMLQYGIDDIRLFQSGDLRFLEQF
ncbi:phenylalanine--tRNA ligase subunit alpha [Candidatus Falkowbacteria bacterium]|nr:phenylalanine--tRNA ligase subunit alpha [Candidatus Falkowbacteria bacterium]